MNLSPIVAEGVRLARMGDFSLLDCMELVDRRNAGDSFDGGRRPSFVARVGGHTLIGYCEAAEPARYGSSDDCEACGGDGTLIARGANGGRYTVTCPECDGEGSVEGFEDDDDDDDAPITWLDLNGEPATVEPTRHQGLGAIQSLSQAYALIDKAKKALAAPLAEAA